MKYKRPHDRELVKTNPLLAAWEHYNIDGGCWIMEPKGWLARHKYVNRYGFAVPSPEALETIAKYSPIVELGAGRGYWAWLLARDHRVDIIAYDAKKPGFGNHWFRTKREFHPIIQGNTPILKKHKDRALFICWPYMDDMAFEALTAYEGTTFIYIGEFGGCTANEEFFNLLEKEWEQIEEVAIPQWGSMHDRLVIYKRKSHVEDV